MDNFQLKLIMLTLDKTPTSITVERINEVAKLCSASDILVLEDALRNKVYSLDATEHIINLLAALWKHG